MSSAIQTAATLDDLYRVKGKAELIAGRIVPLMPTGRRPSRVASRIFRSLDDYATATGRGEAFGDNTGFAVAVLSVRSRVVLAGRLVFLAAVPVEPDALSRRTAHLRRRGSKRERLRSSGRGSAGGQAG